MGGECLKPSVPVVLTVEEVEHEARDVYTLYLSVPEPAGARGRGARCSSPGTTSPAPAGAGLNLLRFTPGQFFMVWIPRMDEKPYAISSAERRRVGITVQRRGPFSTRLTELRPGARLGLRGPFGRGFGFIDRFADSDRVALVGGGCGMAVLAPLAERLGRATIVQGARTADGLLFRDRFPTQVLFTDDGSAGRRGYPTDWLRERAEEGALDIVYTCGPEVMMSRVADLCREGGVRCQVCMERYVKCGIGVCGQCDCDGRRICLDGPVFDLHDLAEMPSFGRQRRDKTGRRIPVTPDESCPTAPESPDP
ncbi:MAG: dihydroorotate dehydrogenase electron transfer subunit [Planctomycetota bacterium]